MTITWECNQLGTVSLTVPEDEVMKNIEALNLLGFDVEVSL
jgi:hypothetical protein